MARPSRTRDHEPTQVTYAKARRATLRADLISIAARTARHGRGHLTMNLPEDWHREHEWMNLFEAACGPPAHRPDQPRPVTAPYGPASRQPRSRQEA